MFHEKEDGDVECYGEEGGWEGWSAEAMDVGILVIVTLFVLVFVIVIFVG